MISAWLMTEPNDFLFANIMSASTQCGMQHAGAENYRSRRLVKSGKLEKVKKKMIITLGTDARRGHVKTAEKFSEKLSTQINMLNGNHRSFMKPWEDVNLLLKTLFMKIKSAVKCV